MKNLFAGRRGEVTPRDRELMRDIFFVDRATVGHLARLHFPGCATRRPYNRLNQLKRKKLLSNEIFSVTDGTGKSATLHFFSLTREARAALREQLLAEGVTMGDLFAQPQIAKGNPEYEGLGPLDPSQAYHLSRVGDLYVRLKGGLQKELGTSGLDWLWRNERRAFFSYTRANDLSGYRPDAELVIKLPLPDDAGPEVVKETFHLFIEVQTARSRATSDEMIRKVANHFLAANNRDFPDSSRRLLVIVAETRAHLEAAREAALRWDVPLLLGDIGSVASRIIEKSRRPAELAASPRDETVLLASPQLRAPYQRTVFRQLASGDSGA